jgi:hypothetical protein
MELTINSRNHGTVTFFANLEVRDSAYMFIDFDGNNPGTLGKQICEGGRMSGNTVRVYGAPNFEKKCRSWWNAYLRNQKG